MGKGKIFDFFLNSKNNKWYTPDDIKNYLLDDTILDWLEKYGKNKNLNPNYTKNEFGNFLKKQYIDLNDLIKKKLYNYSDDIEIINSQGIINKIDNTIKAIENRKSVIINPVLCNIENNTYGYSNIIIKSDLLLDIFPFLNEIDYNFYEGCEFSNNWHYILLDCTLCTLIINEID